MGCLIKDSVMYSSGSARLFDLLDVNISNPSNGELLQYNSTNGKWENSADVWDTMAQNGAHNYCNYTLNKANVGTVTYTENADRSITLNGTPTGDSSVNLYNFNIPKGKYILSGIGDAVNVRFGALGLFKGATQVKLWMISSTEDFEFDTSAYDYDEVNIYMTKIETNVACSGTVYPMIRLASDHNTDYAPYAPTNHDLAYVRDGWQKNGAYNLLPKELYASTQASHGITWTVHSDGSVGTSNTSKDNTNESFVLLSRTSGYTVPAGQYCFCGKPSASKYRMMLQCTRGGVLTMLADLDNDTTRAVVTIQEGDALQIALIVKSGETGGDTFYPMLTTDLSATNADFTTPAKTNRELTEDIAGKWTTIDSGFPSPLTGMYVKYKKVDNMCFVYGRLRLPSGTIMADTAYDLATGLPLPNDTSGIRVNAFYTSGWLAKSSNLQVGLDRLGRISLYGHENFSTAGDFMFHMFYEIA